MLCPPTCTPITLLKYLIKHRENNLADRTLLTPQRLQTFCLQQVWENARFPSPLLTIFVHLCLEHSNKHVGNPFWHASNRSRSNIPVSFSTFLEQLIPASQWPEMPGPYEGLFEGKLRQRERENTAFWYWLRDCKCRDQTKTAADTDKIYFVGLV